MSNILTEDTNASPDRIRYYGDPISMFDFNAKSVMPAFKQRWDNSAHSYSGLIIKDATPDHDTPTHPLTPSPEDSKAEVITEWTKLIILIFGLLFSYKIINYGSGYVRVET